MIDEISELIQKIIKQYIFLKNLRDLRIASVDAIEYFLVDFFKKIFKII